MCHDVSAQERNHVDWKFNAVRVTDREWKLEFTAVIDKGWHLYSQKVKAGGPMPTTFVFDKPTGASLVGKVGERGSVRHEYDETFMMDVAWYENRVTFVQRVKAKQPATIQGEIQFSVCSKDMCVPGSAKFSIEVRK